MLSTANNLYYQKRNKRPPVKIKGAICYFNLEKCSNRLEYLLLAGCKFDIEITFLFQF
jgi:hypothetical protein